MFTTHERLCPRSGEIVSTLVGETAVIIHVATGTCYTTNQVGGLIWRMIATRHSLEETVAAILDHYDVEREQASRDVVHFAAELFQRKLICASETSTSSQRWPIKPRERQSYELPMLNIHGRTEDVLSVVPVVNGQVKVSQQES